MEITFESVSKQYKKKYALKNFTATLNEGVYGSEQGNYVATAVLGSDLTVRVYDAASGELVAAEVIENSDPTYFYRIPRIYLLDKAKTAVVVLGGSIDELDTLVSVFEF